MDEAPNAHGLRPEPPRLLCSEPHLLHQLDGAAGQGARRDGRRHKAGGRIEEARALQGQAGGGEKGGEPGGRTEGGGRSRCPNPIDRRRAARSVAHRRGHRDHEGVPEGLRQSAEAVQGARFVVADRAVHVAQRGRLHRADCHASARAQAANRVRRRRRA